MFSEEIREKSKIRYFLPYIFGFRAGSVLSNTMILSIDRAGARMIIGRSQPEKSSYRIDAAVLISPDGGISFESIVKDRDAFCFLLRQSAKGMLRGVKNFIGIVPEEEIFYKIVSIPRVNMIEGGVLHALESALPIDSSEMLISYENFEPIAGYPDHSDYAMWAARKSYIEAFSGVCEPIGIKAQDFISEGKALAKAAFPALETRNAVLIISVLSERSVFIIFAGRAIHFSGVLPFGSSILRNDSPEIDRFITEIQQAIFFYRNRAFHEHGASNEVNRLFFSGSFDKRILDRISFNTQLHIETLDWFSDIEFSKETASIIKNNSAEFMPLIGALKHYSKI